MLLDIEKRRRTTEWFFNLDHSDSYHPTFEGSIAHIFDNHWNQLLSDPEVQTFPLRPSIIKNVDKMIRCAKHKLGYDLFLFPQCLNTSFKRCFDVPHRHITFTIDSSLRNYFRKDRSLLNILFASAAETLFSVFSAMCNKRHTLTPGFMLTLHTFGRDLKWNPHLHSLVTEGGITHEKLYKRTPYISFESLRKRFMKILLYKLMDHFATSFKKVKNACYNNHKNGFYVHAPSNESRDVVDMLTYVLRYTGRPVMAQSRIEAYSQEEDAVIWHYIDHETEERISNVFLRSFFIFVLLYKIMNFPIR